MTKPSILFIAIVLSIRCVSAQQSDDLVITIRLLDPRIVTNTSDKMGIELGDQKTDIIASRTLTDSQRDKLIKLLDEDLLSDTSTNYCGHYPIP